MKKILFIQLPPPRFDFGEAPLNIPLAAGFMDSALKFSQERQSFDGPEIESAILDRGVSDVYGDLGLISAIKNASPDVLLMTLYVWNVQRSLFIAAMVKRDIPHLKTLAGGPEVTRDNEWVLAHPAVDAGVFGEGESRIHSALNCLVTGQPLAGIPGSFYKDGQELVINNESPEPWDLDCRPYPYLNGTLDPANYPTVFVETARGCPFKCRYCFYHKSFDRTRFYSHQRLEALFEHLYSDHSAVSEIYLMDPTFNARPDFRGILSMLANLRAKKEIKLHAELRSDLLSGSDIQLFREAGLASAEIGLQSTNRKALKAAGRKGDPGRVISGADKLRKSGVEVTTGIILGLPEDSPKGFSRTMSDLKDSGAYSVIHPFALSVLPGTDFRLNAHDLGLRFQNRPPYYVYETRTFSRESLRDCLMEFESMFDTELDHINPPSLVSDSDSVVRSIESESYVSKWIISDTTAYGGKLVEAIAQKSTDPFTVWFKKDLRGEATHWACETLRTFTDHNPYTSLHIVLEHDELPEIRTITALMEVTARPELYLNRYYQPLYQENEVVSPCFWILVQLPESEKEKLEIVEEYSPFAKIVWTVNDINLLRLANAEAPLLVRTQKNCNVRKISNIFKVIKDINEDCIEEVLFERGLHQSLWNARVRNLSNENRLSEIILFT